MTELGARVVALAGAIATVLALSLPWVYEHDTTVVREDDPVLRREVLTPDGEQWTGWTLYSPGDNAAAAVLAIGGSLLVLIACWVSFEERRRRWLAPATAGLALVLLIASVPILNNLDVPTTFGIGVWRLALVFVLLGSVRLALAEEEAGRRPVPETGRL